MTSLRVGKHLFIAALVVMLLTEKSLGQRSVSAASSARFHVARTVDVSATLEGAGAPYGKTDDLIPVSDDTEPFKSLEYTISGSMLKEVLVGMIIADDLVWHGLANTSVGSGGFGGGARFGDVLEVPHSGDRDAEFEQEYASSFEEAKGDGTEALALVVVFPNN